MNPFKLLAELESLDVRLAVDGEDGLAFDAPEEVMTPDLVDRVRAHRALLVRLLRRRAAGVPDTLLRSPTPDAVDAALAGLPVGGVACRGVGAVVPGVWVGEESDAAAAAWRPYGEDAEYVYLERLAIADSLGMPTGPGSVAEAIARLKAGRPTRNPTS